jgi:hypothetical protein
MLRDLEDKYPDNKEITYLNEIFSDIIIKKQVYKSAFVENRTLQRILYKTIAIQLVYGVLRNYLIHINPVESKNEMALVLSNKDYKGGDEENIKVLEGASKITHNIEEYTNEKSFSVLMISGGVLLGITVIIKLFYLTRLLLSYSQDVKLYFYNILNEYSHVKRTINQKNPSKSDKIILRYIANVEKIRDKFFLPYSSKKENLNQFLYNNEKKYTQVTNNVIANESVPSNGPVSSNSFF